MTDLQTQLLHIHNENGSPLNSHSFPIFQTSTFFFDSTEHGANCFAGKESGHIYSRLGNPTVEYFESMCATADQGVGAVAFGAGMGAISASTLSFLNSGDHIICGDTLYGCTVSLFEHWFKQFKIEVDFVDTSKVDEVKNHWKENTKMVYLETPANPTCKVSDLVSISKLCKERNAKLVVDCTFSSPVFLPALTLGADIVVHSITKYINGHGDVVGGVCIAKTKEDLDKLRFYRKDFGSLMAPMDAYLAARGMKTLPLRMKAHMENGLKVAKFLQQHPKVKKVLHPGLEDFEGHEIAKQQMKGYGSTFSFLMNSYEDAKNLMEHLNICTLAVSLGCVDTLIEHPASMTHAAVPPEIMAKQGLCREMVRISVGIENADDIIEDLRQALDKI